MTNLYRLKIKEILNCAIGEGFSFCLICLYLLFEYVRPQSIYTKFDILPWVTIVLFFTIISLLASKKSIINSPCVINKLMIVYGIIVLLSSVFSLYPDKSLSKLRVFFDWFVIYFLIVKIVNNEKRFFIFLLLFLLFSFKMSQHGFISWMKRGFGFASWGVTGAPGWFHNSGEVGIQMCIYIPLSLLFIISIYKYVSKIWLIILVMMPFTGVATIVASSSRGAMLGLLGASLFLILKSTKKLFKTGIFFIIIFAIVYIYIPKESLDRFNNMGDDSTSLHRIERWEAGIDTLLKYPILGCGFESWVYYYPDNYNPKFIGSHLVHNIFIQCASELGFSGLITFILMIISCFSITHNIRSEHNYSSDKFVYYISHGLDTALIGFLISGSFVTVLYYPYFWIHCAFVACLKNVADSKFS